MEKTETSTATPEMRNAAPDTQKTDSENQEKTINTNYMQQFPVIRPIDKGWSADRKFYVETQEGSPYLLRVSAIQRSNHRRDVFRQMKVLERFDLPMNRAVDLAEDEEYVYTLQSWIDGEDLETVLPTKNEEEQYALGQEAGRIVRQIHRLEAPKDAPSWEVHYQAKIDRKIKLYKDCSLKYENDGELLKVIAQDREKFADRPMAYQHGDFHSGNMMVDRAGRLQIIDFDRSSYGDPWEEFNRIPWCVQMSPALARGMVDGYFDNDVPTRFWVLLRLYIYVDTLSSLPWAIPFGDGEVKVMRDKAAEILGWYERTDSAIPSWYREA